jgi:hypothetical protein
MPSPVESKPTHALRDLKIVITTSGDSARSFDGTAIAIGPSISDKPGARLTTSGVTFQVNEWFKGGSGDTVTVDMWGFGAASE